MENDFDKIDDTLELKPHYVYALYDTSNKDIFYIGKGSGRRVEDHEKEANREDGNETEKLNKIRTLKEQGYFGYMILGRFYTAKEALAVESTLIKWVYGIENLTNKLHGHNEEFIRELKKYGKYEHLDLPEEKKYERSGEYSEDLKNIRDEFGIVSMMEKVRIELNQRLGDVFTEVDTSSNKQTRLKYIYNDFKIVVFCGHSKNKLVGIEVYDANSKSKNIKALCELDNNLEPKGKPEPKWAKITKNSVKVMKENNIIDEDGIDAIVSDFNKIVQIIDLFTE